MYETHTTTKGQIVIPAAIRRQLGITQSTRIQIEVNEKDNSITLRPVTRARVQRLLGRYRGAGLLEELAAEKAREKAR
jgi:AbrB family looped-hinge helix DNA binding protein